MPNRWAELDDAVAFAIAVRRLGTARNLAAIDLQFGESQFLRLFQRREAASKIVDGDLNVVKLELNGDLARQVRIADHFVFGQFDNQPGKSGLPGKYFLRLPTKVGVSKIEIGMLIASFVVTLLATKNCQSVRARRMT